MIPVDTMDGAGRVPAGLDALVGLHHHRKPPEGVRSAVVAASHRPRAPTNACLRSTCRLSWHSTGPDGVQEGLVVPVVLVGV